MHRTARTLVIPAGLLALALFSPRSSWAAWPTDTLANVPLCSAAGNQVVPVAVADGSGGAVVAWTDSRGANPDVYAQLIPAGGTVAWTADGVLVGSGAGMQQYPLGVPDGAGGAILLWRDTRSGGYYDLYVQRLSSGGVAQWTANGVVVSASANDKLAYAIASDGSGGAIVAWRENRTGFGEDIFAQRISSGGAVQWTSTGLAVCAATRDQDMPSIASDGAHGAIITWADPRTSYTDYDVFAQRVSAAGAVQWTADGVALCTATGNQDRPVIVSDDAGGAIVGWEDFRAGTWDIYLQRLSDTGAVQWTANGVGACTSDGHQMLPALVSDGASGAIVTWQDARTGYLEYDVYAQRIAAAGTAQWTANGVALSTAANAQAYPTIGPDGAGGAIVTWQDWRPGSSTDVYAQHVSSAGSVDWQSNGVQMSDAAGDQAAPVVVSDGAGGALIAWEDYRNPTADIYVQRIWSNGSTPVLLSLVSADEGADGITLTWFADRSEGAPATVYRSVVPGEWSAIGEVAADGTGYLRFTDRTAPAAGRVGYRLGIRDAGTESYQGETWVERTVPAFALHGVSPNPARGSALAVRFSLAAALPATLDLLDVSGRRLASREVGALGSGRHTLAIGEGMRLAPGLYLVRLRQGEHTQVTRVAVFD